MKIVNLEIENFRAIKKLKMSNLEDMVVIAGTNGCGKSCIFHAIRLFKSIYGNYIDKELEKWFNEFQINTRNPQVDFVRLFQDNKSNVSISVGFLFHEKEKEFILKNCKRNISKSSLIRAIAPLLPGEEDRPQTSLAKDIRTNKEKIEYENQTNYEQVQQELEKPFVAGKVIISPDLEIAIMPCKTLGIAFSIFQPQSLGVIDYHGSNRNYGREQINSLNLNTSSVSDRLSQNALYNYNNKYSNIKSNIATSYIRELVAKEAGIELPDNLSLAETLKELFEIFFPGKNFLGTQPTKDGDLLFPVQLESGKVHDINELSDGEKEVLYSYLRIRNNQPKNSIILIDEPEVHLNPKLIQGLPQFYHQHIGKIFNNQIWLTTHSDTFLRETVGKEGFSVYHLRSASNSLSRENQVHLISAEGDLEQAVIDLVGDLATYQPDAKVVIFEGENSEFDLNMVCTLFPEFRQSVNPLSGGNKKGVRKLHELLDRAVDSANISARFFSIVDRDLEGENRHNTGKSFTWDVYHIENYLLNSRFILKVIEDNNLGNSGNLDHDKIDKLLKECAEETLNFLVYTKLQDEINNSVVRCIQIQTNPNQDKYAESLFLATEKSLNKIQNKLSNDFSLSNLQEKEQKIRYGFEQDLENNNWKKTFRGRDILKRFINKYNSENKAKPKYEQFRNNIIARMRDEGYQPEGMKAVISFILES
ncbi:MAG: AAA family ATPase [Cyanobacteria bacterium J06648_1]